MGVAGGKVPEVASGLNTIVKLVDNIERICTDHVGNVYLSLRRKSTDSDVALIYIYVSSPLECIRELERHTLSMYAHSAVLCQCISLRIRYQRL